ncbi:MAG: alpha-xylosidase [Clostridiales bacterium]|nr:alpha-xylosidase [Clostridiales bacterium]
MKFTDGLWTVKEGYQLQYPKEIADIRYSDSGITLYAPYQEQNQVTDSIGCGMLTVHISAPGPNMLSVKITNHRGSRASKVCFDLNRTSVKPQSSETENEYIYASSLLEARLSKTGNWGISFYFSGMYLTSTDIGGMAHITAPDGSTYIREQLNLSEGEYIYGLGECPGSIIRNGGTYTVWNEDAGIEYGKSSKCVPFFLSSKGYGIVVNSNDPVSYEIGNDATTSEDNGQRTMRTQFSLAGETMEYIFIGGASMKHILDQYSELIGRPSLPPAWSFGTTISTSMYGEMDEDTVYDIMEQAHIQGLPLSVIHFGPSWMKNFEWTSFLWDKERFPNPAQMLKKMHERGVRACLWVSPYISQKSPLFQEGFDANYFVNLGNGDVWQTDQQQPGSALVDFTFLVARGWYQKYIDDLMNMGVDTFQLDFGSDAPVAAPQFGADAVRHNISYRMENDALSMHNRYCYLFSEAVFEVVKRYHGKNSSFIISHSATVGSQKFPFLSMNNTVSSYEGMQNTLRSALSLSLSGFPFWSQNIGGTADDCPADLYMRWHQAAMFSPHAQTVGSYLQKTPWNYGPDAVNEALLFSKFKLGMMPYIFASAVESTSLGVPMTRPMVLEFPDDPNVAALDQQYMLGGNILVAPITSPDGIVRYYVPSGIWTNLLTRERVEGPIWKNEQHGYSTMPILARPGTVLVAGQHDTTPLYNYLENVTITLFEIPEGAEVVADVYSADLKNEGFVRVTRKNNRITVNTQGLFGQIRLLLANIFQIASTSAGVPELNEWGTLIVFEGPEISIALP